MEIFGSRGLARFSIIEISACGCERDNDVFRPKFEPSLWNSRWNPATCSVKRARVPEFPSEFPLIIGFRARARVYTRATQEGKDKRKRADGAEKPSAASNTDASKSRADQDWPMPAHYFDHPFDGDGERKKETQELEDTSDKVQHQPDKYVSGDVSE
jgi:hypothetical protein